MTIKRVFYGSDSLQFGDLRIPDGQGPFPVIVIIHGGCWLNQYDYTLMDDMAEDLTQRGYATWNLEYRRLGDDRGGWPHTFLDVAHGVKKIKDLSEQYMLDMDQILLTGHSAGGHLALWLSGMDALPSKSPIKLEGMPPIKGVASLAGISDLDTYRSKEGCGRSVEILMQGPPSNYPGRYMEASPMRHRPHAVPRILVNGTDDDIVPVSHVKPYYEAVKSSGQPVELVLVEKAGHFEVIRPGSIAWEPILDAFRRLRMSSR